MPPFISTFTNKLDAKGRVSIPAPYRQILAQQEMGALYCIPSFVSPCLEAFGNSLLAKFTESLGQYDALFTEAHDDAAQAVLAAVQQLNLDDEGRVRLPEQLIKHAGINEQVVFVGLGQKFQMWDPVRFEPVMAERVARARALRSAGTGGAA